MVDPGAEGENRGNLPPRPEYINTSSITNSHYSSFSNGFESMSRTGVVAVFVAGWPFFGGSWQNQN